MGDTKIACGCALVAIVALGALIIGLIVSSLHNIDEGNVGVYYKYGALMDDSSAPGMHTMQPFVTTVEQVMVRPDTYTLNNIYAITRDGIQIEFRDVQVIVRVQRSGVVKLIRKFGKKFLAPLVFDRIREEIRLFSANHTIDDIYNEEFLTMVKEVRDDVVTSVERLGGGVEILNLVIPKPDIPDDIEQNYKAVKIQWTAQLVSTQEQKTAEIKKETEMLRAIADAKRKKKVLEITIQEQILEKEGAQNVSRINNDILKEREENLANIEAYKIERLAQANKELFSPEYVKLKIAESMGNSTKFYFSGENSPMGSIFSKLIN